MKLKKIVFKNFRSYYKECPFNLSDGLTLLIGSNGDGKTTFIEALEWLFNKDAKDKPIYVSAKRLNDLAIGEADEVSVSMTFDHKGEEHIIEKSFNFEKENENTAHTSGYNCTLYKVKGVERSIVPNGAERFDKYYFNQSVRRYCLFKGENDLNVFNQSDALNLLVETFSDIHSFDDYVTNANFVKDRADVAKDRAASADRKNQREFEQLRSDKDREVRAISDIQQSLNIQKKEASNYEEFIKRYERNKESSSLLQDCNKRIENLKDKRDALSRMIHDDYTIRLLDEMWVLLGYEPIAQEFIDKVGTLAKSKRTAEEEFIKEEATSEIAEQLLTMLPNGKTSLAPYIPDEKTMRDMLDDHVCKVCGTEAPEGSKPYLFMKHRLEEFLKTKVKTTEEKRSPFVYDYITELDKMTVVLNMELPNLAKKYQTILDDIDFNNARKQDLAKYDAAIAKEEETKRHILADTDGMTENQLMNAYEQLTNSYEGQRTAEVKIARLEADLKLHEEKLKEIDEKFSKLVTGSSAETYNRSYLALNAIAKAFENAKADSKAAFLRKLEATANTYLEKLNPDDFHGVIRIIEQTSTNTVEARLMDENDSYVHTPNTALKTTMYMAILFAVADLTTLSLEDNYPLIFDAPTSSFTAAKEQDFFNVISHINKQVIIATKSFLNEDDEVDMRKITGLKASVYRIYLKTPFERGVLSTIQTKIEKLN